MNKKGEEKGLGGIILVAITLIVGVIMLAASAQNLGPVRNTITYGNTTITALTNGTPQYITSCRALSNAIFWNATGDLEIPANNYTLTNNVVYNGALTVRIDPAVQNGAGMAYNKGTPSYQGVCQPTTYDDSSGGRAVAGIIIIMFALAIAVVALWPTLKEAANWR